MSKSYEMYKAAKEQEVEELKEHLIAVGGHYRWRQGHPYVEFTGGEYSHDIKVTEVSLNKNGVIEIKGVDVESGTELTTWPCEIQFSHLEFITDEIKHFES